MNRRELFQAAFACTAVPLMTDCVAPAGVVDVFVADAGAKFTFADIQAAVASLEQNNYPPSPDGFYYRFGSYCSEPHAVER